MSIDSFTALFSTHQEVIFQYRYAILLLVSIFEGTATMIAAGAMIATGFFNPLYALAVCTVAEIINGFIWYTVGYYFGAIPIAFLVRNSPGRQAFMAAIRHHSDRSAGLVVLLVKMTYSVTSATLILIGSLKYNLKRFAFFNILGSIGWTMMLLSLGYAFGQAALAYLPTFRLIGVTIFFILCSVGVLFVLRYFGDTLMRRVRREK